MTIVVDRKDYVHMVPLNLLSCGFDLPSHSASVRSTGSPLINQPRRQSNRKTNKRAPDHYTDPQAKRRKPTRFTLAEDLDLIQYLCTTAYTKYAPGKIRSKQSVVNFANSRPDVPQNHSVSSVQNRLRTIVKNIDRYDVPSLWKDRLTAKHDDISLAISAVSNTSDHRSARMSKSRAASDSAKVKSMEALPETESERTTLLTRSRCIDSSLQSTLEKVSLGHCTSKSGSFAGRNESLHKDSSPNTDSRMVKKIAELFRLTIQQVVHAVFVNDGSMFDAVVWLSKEGNHREPKQSKESLAVDLALLANSGHCPLHPKQGLSSSLISRLEFLQGDLEQTVGELAAHDMTLTEGLVMMHGYGKQFPND